MIQNPVIQGVGVEIETAKVAINVENHDDRMYFYALGVNQDGQIVSIYYDNSLGVTFDVVKDSVCVFTTSYPGMRPPSVDVVGNAESLPRSSPTGAYLVFRALGDCSIEYA